MAYTINRTEAFERDLGRVLDFYRNDLESPTAATKLINAISSAFDSLEQNPFLHAISRKPILEVHELREFFVKKYVIVYGVDDGEVILYGFFHQRQFYDSKFLSREGIRE